MPNFSMFRGTTQPFSGLAVYGGGGLTTAPSVLISGGGGTGANAQTIIAGGNVVGFVLTAGGTGYTGTPTVTVGGGLIGVQATATVAGGIVTAITLDPVDLSVSGVDIRVLYKLGNASWDSQAVLAFTLLGPGSPPFAGAVTLPNGGADGAFAWTLLPAHTDPSGNARMTNIAVLPLLWTARVYLPTSPVQVFDLSSGILTLTQESVRATT